MAYVYINAAYGVIPGSEIASSCEIRSRRWYKRNAANTMEFVARLDNKMDLYERVSVYLEEWYIRNIGDGISFIPQMLNFHYWLTRCVRRMLGDAGILNVSQNSFQRSSYSIEKIRYPCTKQSHVSRVRGKNCDKKIVRRSRWTFPLANFHPGPFQFLKSLNTWRHSRASLTTGARQKQQRTRNAPVASRCATRHDQKSPGINTSTLFLSTRKRAISARFASYGQKRALDQSVWQLNAQLIH